MYDAFDSRGLHSTNCYGKRLNEPGTYGYAILPMGAELLDDDRPFVVTVDAQETDEPSQTAVAIRWDGSHFAAEPAAAAIHAGDVVLWHCADTGAPLYVITGDGDLGSDALAGESVYTHAFGLPGRYEWVDAIGGDVGGVVTVKDVSSEHAAGASRWRKRLREGALVTIEGGSCEPTDVEIITGQTVFFAVASGGDAGVTVTDRRLVDPAGTSA